MPQLKEPVSVEAIREAFPPEGLFADKDWLLSPEPFPLRRYEVEELEKLGHRLHIFLRACNELYQLSAQGRRAPWVADYLDRGKPEHLAILAREKALRNQLPAVIRPDLVLTESGFALAEIDSVPGGIGLTAWLNRTYAKLGSNVVGGAEGMVNGFATVVADGDIVISRESATYRPEMTWLARQINASGRSRGIEIFDAETYETRDRRIYRFFELFDLPNLPAAGRLLEAAGNGALEMTPPPKAFLEEKMWLALFWMRPLRGYWRRELSERHWLQLQKIIPQSWVLDPTPLPHHAVIPGLEIHDWMELAAFSQKERELVLKISGFSDIAWGSRGVTVGQDMSHAAWAEALTKALAAFPTHPHVLQRFHKGRLVEHPYFDRDTGEPRRMQGRVRLCPYYFVVDGRTQLGGVLATICPADKKLLHGMKDAILVPCSITDDR